MKSKSIKVLIIMLLLIIIFITLIYRVKIYNQAREILYDKGAKLKAAVECVYERQLKVIIIEGPGKGNEAYVGIETEERNKFKQGQEILIEFSGIAQMDLLRIVRDGSIQILNEKSDSEVLKKYENE